MRGCDDDALATLQAERDTDWKRICDLGDHALRLLERAEQARLDDERGARE